MRVELWSDEKDLGLTRVRQLVNAQHILLENIGHEAENIDFIYFAKTKEVNCIPNERESKEFYWMTEDEIKKDKGIKGHIKVMALEALHKVCKN